MKQLGKFPYVLEVIAVLGLILYVWQSWQFANSLDSIGDEGAYLYKGYMFARGDYRPFQDYGFWTNKSSLAFLIPGYIQLWFGPGLRVARYFSIVLGVLMMVGIWVTTRHLGGRVWAALAVWIFALSNAQIIIYSEAVSQVLVACMMAWMFALTLGENKPLWQLVLGSALSIIIVMTRQNLVIVPAMLVLYIFWQHGKKAGIWALFTSAVLFIGFHIYYWPNILQLWAPWVPASLTPFLNAFRVPMDYDIKYVVFKPSVLSMMQSFATGMRDNFFVFFGSVSALAVFPKRNQWKSDGRFKMAVFLGIMFLILFVMHTLASLFIPYCVYCFSGYQMFYTTAGFFFVLVIFLNGINDSKPRQILLALVVLFFAGTLGLSYLQGHSAWFLNHVQLPSVNRIFTRGELSTVSLRDVFTYSLNITIAVQKRLGAILEGIFLGAVVWIVMWILYRFFLHRSWLQKYAFVNMVLFFCLVFGTLYPFSTNLQALFNSKCSTNYLSYYEDAGKSLAQLVPPGSLVYWRGSGKQLALMLYMKNIKIFPPLIQAGAGYVVGEETQQILKFGLFNQELNTQWRESADILIVWKNRPEYREILQLPNYERIPYDMGELAKCEDALFVFRRTQ